MMLDTVRETIAKYDMFNSGDSVLVAVSGGPDSITLLHVLWALREELSISLSVAHLNHGLRGEEADEEAEFVREFASKLGLPAYVEKVQMYDLNVEMRLSMQEAARKVRYEFLHRVASSVGAQRIAIAHNADDQAETVLLNIIRGAGIDGASGIPPVRGEIVRPLIEVYRSEIMDYLRENTLDYRTDPSNLKTTYTRNKVRLELIPFVEERFNPSVKSALISLSELARTESDFVRAEASRLYRELAKEKQNEVAFDSHALLGLHKAIARRVLRMAIERVRGDLRDIELRQVDRILEYAKEGREFGLMLPSGVVKSELRTGTLRIFQEEPEPELPTPFEYLITIPGTVMIEELGHEIMTEHVQPGARFPAVSEGALLDAEKIKGSIVIRNWLPGDRMVPLGMSGSKKLQDMFTDAKIARRDRVSIPVVADAEKILWVPGLAVSELVKVDRSTTKTVLLVLK